MNQSISYHWWLPEFHWRKWDNHYISNSESLQHMYQNWMISLLCILNLQVWWHEYYYLRLGYIVLIIYIFLCLLFDLFEASYIWRKSKLQLTVENWEKRKGHHWGPAEGIIEGFLSTVPFPQNLCLISRVTVGISIFILCSVYMSPAQPESFPHSF